MRRATESEPPSFEAGVRWGTGRRCPRFSYMDERSLKYKMSATACEKLASASTDRVAKATYRDLAHQWRELARQVEMLDSERPDENKLEAVANRTMSGF